MDRTSNSVEYGILINQQNYDGYAIIAEIRQKVRGIVRLFFLHGDPGLAGLLVQTPYVLLMGIPGINVVSAAEFAGEMGPIERYATARAITGRAGLFPSRYQSDHVDYPDGQLVRCANRNLRRAIMMIADNLVKCNDHFRVLPTRSVSRWLAGSAGSPTRWWLAARRTGTPAASSGITYSINCSSFILTMKLVMINS